MYMNEQENTNSEQNQQNTENVESVTTNEENTDSEAVKKEKEKEKEEEEKNSGEAATEKGSMEDSTREKKDSVSEEKDISSETNVPEEEQEEESKEKEEESDMEMEYVKNAEENEDEEKDEDEDEDEEDDEESHLSDNSLQIDYNKFSREELVDRLKELINSDKILDIKKEIDIIKATFYKKHRAHNEEKKKEFIKAGGNPEEFVPEKDKLEQDLKDYLKRYKELKAERNKNLEDEKKNNLNKKYEVIEELKNLVNKKESLGQTFKEFRDLQRRWKEIGPVPQSKVKDLWGTYHHHVEKFYDYVKINKELRDLDLKKNLEAKLELCEKAEELDEEKDILNAFKTLQSYHDQWREIGPVPNEQKEELWQRFKEATRKINKKHQEYFKELRKKQNENFEAKEELCKKAEEIAETEIDNHKDWKKYTQEVLDLQKKWRTIGFAPKKYNNKIYRRFRKACDRFFAQKRVFYTQHKEWQESNLKKKEEFVERAEALKDSTDWDNTAKELIKLQREWKEIGPVPKKYSEDVWQRFRNACDHFFQRKKEQSAHKNKDFEENLKQKKDLINRINDFEPVNDTDENLKQLQKFEEEWENIGYVPYKQKDKIQQDYREAIYNQYDKLGLNQNQKELLKYRSKIKNITQKPKAESRMRQEREKFINKIKKLETNIITWENNLGFISSDSSEANTMIHDFQEKIEDAKNEIEVLEEKVKIIDQLDSE